MIKPKSLRVGTKLRATLTVTHRYDDYVLCRCAVSDNTVKLFPDDVDAIVSQPMEEGDHIRLAGYGGTGRYIEACSNLVGKVIVEMVKDEPKIVKLSDISLVDVANPTGA